ncbi:MAG: AraC family transcriptional regulator [Cyanobacteriota bacterium]|nr:AraC family transcriptional regulator [Cyanobacteriota bacterium]
MSQEQRQTLDLNGEYIEHIHLLSSEDAQWDKLNLIYEREPAGEMPETELDRHALVICLGNFRASFEINGRWQHRDYAAGDIALFSAREPLPKTQFDCTVPLLELFLDPIALLEDADNGTNVKSIELLTQLQVRDPLIYQMGIALMEELQAGGTDSRLYAESMATALSVHLLRRYSSHNAEFKQYSGGLSKVQLKTVIDYIRDRLDQNLSLAELAAIVHLSPRYFASLFKQSTGLAPYQYIIQCRVERAKTLLRQPELPLVEVARQVGFQNQSHFTRVFRQYVSVTPKVYRKML